MSERDERLLGQMLFGEGEFERDGAPEPELLAELAELLPEPVMEAAIRAVGGVGVVDRDSRERLLERLLTALPRSAWESVAVPLELLAQLLLSVPEELLPRLVERMERLEPGSEERAHAVLALDRRLRDERTREMVRSEALRWAAKANRWSSLDQLLVDLIAALRPPIPPEELAALEAGARTVEAPRRRCRALAVLAWLRPAENRGALMAEALANARAAEPEQKAAALAEIAPALPEPQRREAIDEAIAAARAAATKAADETLLALSLQCAPDQRRRLVAELVGRYEEDGVEWPSAAERVAQRAASIVRAGRVGDPQAMREIVSGLELPADMVWDLAPYMSPNQFEDTLSGLAERLLWPDPEISVAAVTPHLPPKVLDRLARRVQRAPAPEGQRVRVLTELAPGMSKRQRQRTARAAADLEEAWSRGRLRSTLAPYLKADSPEAYGELASPDSEVSPERLRELFSRLPEERRLEMSAELIDRVWDRHGGSAAMRMDDHGGAQEEAAEEEGASSGSGEAPAAKRPARIQDIVRRPGGERSMRGDPPRRDDEPPARLHYVNRGFAPHQHPDLEADPYLPLDPEPEYYFWLEIADRRLRGDAGREGAVVDIGQLPDEATLVVALFGFPGEIGVVPGQDVGRLKVRDDGAVAVLQPVAKPELLEDPSLVERRLFFPVTLPADREQASLRCNLYCSGVLVQSHLVTVRLVHAGAIEVDGDIESGGMTPEMADLLRDAGEQPDELGIDARVDYTLSHSLRAGPLNRIEPHALSVMLNGNGDGSHSFRFFADPGAEPFKEESTLSADHLETELDYSRQAMRMAAWGKRTPWTEDSSFRYAKKVDLDTLTTDLARLAKAGYRIYTAMINQLAAGGDRAEIRQRKQKLRELMKTTGLVQVASKDSATDLIPAAILHDHFIDTSNTKSADFDLCPLFAKALKEGIPVVETDCFRGACPSAKEMAVVCPSGFWGYRHRIGMPLSVPEAGDTVAVEIDYSPAPRLGLAAWAGKDFESRAGHEKALGALHPGWTWDRAVTGEDLEKLLLAAPHLLYFYCHGGHSQGVPFLKIGTDEKTYRFDLTLAENLSQLHDLFWEDPRPLVLLNGCHTTALKPGDAFNLVMPFIETLNAAGVIGTEITIFEPLAVAFAEEFLRLFLEGVSLGEAVRLSRIKLLEDRNPLGLVYIPFALAGLTLRPAAAAAGG